MNSGDDSDIERQLLQMELRRPPAEWKALLLPKPVPPLFPKPLLAGWAACWAASLVFSISAPESEDLGPPMLPPTMAPASWNHALAYQPDIEQ